MAGTNINTHDVPFGGPMDLFAEFFLRFSSVLLIFLFRLYRSQQEAKGRSSHGSIQSRLPCCRGPDEVFFCVCGTYTGVAPAAVVASPRAAPALNSEGARKNYTRVPNQLNWCLDSLLKTIFVRKYISLSVCMGEGGGGVPSRLFYTPPALLIVLVHHTSILFNSILKLYFLCVQVHEIFFSTFIIS